MKKTLKKIGSKILYYTPFTPTWAFKQALNFARGSNRGFKLFTKDYTHRDGISRLAVKASLGFWYCGDLTDSYETAWVIFRKGFLEPQGTNLAKFFFQYFGALKDRVIFYDIGANTGYYSLMAAFLGKGKITAYGFEPVNEFYRTAQESVFLNRLEETCHLYNYALGDKDQDTEILMSGTGSTLNFTAEDSSSGKFEFQKIKEATLDGFVEKELLKDPDFIKMDVEGYEYRVLEGGRKTLTRSTPVIYYEIFYKKKGGELIWPADTLKIEEFLLGLGYEIFTCEEKKLTPMQEFKENLKVPKDKQGVFMNLALHPQKHAGLMQKLKFEYAAVVSKPN